MFGPQWGETSTMSVPSPSMLSSSHEGDLDEVPGEQIDVEDVRTVEFLVRREEVEQEGPEACRVVDGCDVAVAPGCAGCCRCRGPDSTMPSGFSGTVRCPARGTTPVWTTTSSSVEGRIVDR